MHFRSLQLPRRRAVCENGREWAESSGAAWRCRGWINEYCALREDFQPNMRVQGAVKGFDA